MRRPALTPSQQEEVRRRLAAGEGVRPLAREFKVGVATISRYSEQSEQVRTAAEALAAGQEAVAALPAALQHQAVTLADKLRRISDDIASAAAAGAHTARSLHEAANVKAREATAALKAGKEGEATERLRSVAVLTKMGNDAAAVPLVLISSAKDRAMTPPPLEPQIDAAKLSQEALGELLAARDAATAALPR